MLGFVCRAKYLKNIKKTPNQKRTFEIQKASIECDKIKEAMAKEGEAVTEEALDKLVGATEKLEDLGLQKVDRRDLALMEHECKKKIKQTRLKIKKALEDLDMKKLQETSARPEETRKLKNLSSDLKMVVDDFTMLNDSELPKSWISFLCFGWWSGRTFRQIYQSQGGRDNPF